MLLPRTPNHCCLGSPSLTFRPAKAIQSGGLAGPGPLALSLYCIMSILFPGPWNHSQSAWNTLYPCVIFPSSLLSISPCLNFSTISSCFRLVTLCWQLRRSLRRRSSSATDPAKESPTAIAILCTEFTLHSPLFGLWLDLAGYLIRCLGPRPHYGSDRTEMIRFQSMLEHLLARLYRSWPCCLCLPLPATVSPLLSWSRSLLQYWLRISACGEDPTAKRLPKLEHACRAATRPMKGMPHSSWKGAVPPIHCRSLSS